MILVTTDKIEGKEHEALGLVRGTCWNYGDTFHKPPLDEAENSMKEKAIELGADAIVGIRMVSIQREEFRLPMIVVYGTAVKFK